MMRFPSKKGGVPPTSDRMFLSESPSSKPAQSAPVPHHSAAFSAAISDAKIDFQGSSLVVRDAEMVRKVVNFLSAGAKGAGEPADEDRLQRQQYEAQISALNKELDRRTQSLRLLEQKIREITAASEAEISLLRKELEREVEAGRQEIVQLKSQLHESYEERNRLRVAASTTASSSPELQQELTLAKVQLEGANQQLSANREEMERMRQHLIRAQSDLTQCNVQLTRSTTELAHVQNELGKCQTEVGQLKRELAAKEDVVQNLSAALKNMETVGKERSQPLARPPQTPAPQRQMGGEPVRQMGGEPVRQMGGEPLRQMGGEPLRQMGGDTLASSKQPTLSTLANDQEPEKPAVRNLSNRLRAEQSAGATLLEEKQRKKEEMDRLKKEIMLEMRKEVELELHKYGTLFGETVPGMKEAAPPTEAKQTNEPPRRSVAAAARSAPAHKTQQPAEAALEEEPLVVPDVPQPPGRKRTLVAPASVAAAMAKPMAPKGVPGNPVAASTPSRVPAAAAASSNKPALQENQNKKSFVFDTNMLAGGAIPPGVKREVKSLDMLKAVCKAKNALHGQQAKSTPAAGTPAPETKEAEGPGEETS